MHTPEFGIAAKSGYQIGWQDDLAQFHRALTDGRLALDIAAAYGRIESGGSFGARSVNGAGSPMKLRVAA